MLSPLFHFTAAAGNMYVMTYDYLYNEVPLPAKEMEGLPIKCRSMFLTMWCLILQTVYHFTALLNDVAGTNEASPKRPPPIRKIKDTLFALAFPQALYVSSVFWVLYFYDKPLIFPDEMDVFYPPVFNHIMHTTIAIYMIVEVFISSRNRVPKDTAMSIIVAFNLFYTLFLFYIYYISGTWPYPLFVKLDWFGRIMFFVISTIVLIACIRLGEMLDDISSNKIKKRQ